MAYLSVYIFSLNQLFEKIATPGGPPHISQVSLKMTTTHEYQSVSFWSENMQELGNKKYVGVDNTRQKAGACQHN